MASLSVTIIAKNEAHRIRDCLESVKWADEIIVLDSGSTDETRAICREYTDKVFSTDWPGYGAQKNRALDYATKQWILSIDADERLSPKLCAEIQAVIKSSHNFVYQIPRKSWYCGRFIRYGDWHSDYCLRLFQKGQGQFSLDPIHERVIAQGPIKKLQHEILHLSFSNLEEVLDKLNHYSTLSAQMMYKKGKTASLSTAVGHGLWSFFRGYILRRGFLDGKEGLLLALSNSLGTFYRYSKLSYMTKNYEYNK